MSVKSISIAEWVNNVDWAYDLYMKAHAFVVLSKLWAKRRFIAKEKETGIFVIATLRPEVRFGFLHLKRLGHNKITN